jgi:N-acetylneuraminate synthase
MKKVRLIAELCCNHQGQIEIAKDMITTLAKFPQEYRVDVIKFQKRTPEIILSKEKFNEPHPNPKHAFAQTYGLHRQFLEFSKEQHKELKDFCESLGFIYSSSVFDMQSTREILTLNPKIIKVSSANNTDFELLKYLDDNFAGEIHVSLGMTTRKEEEQIVNTIKNNRKNLVLYACSSIYPTQDKDLCLLEISRLKNTYKNDIKAIGFSGHHLGVVPDVIAVTLGAEYVERHFTLDKSWKGTDQSLSLNAEDFLELSKNIRMTEKALSYKNSEILPNEQSIRKRLKQGV